MSTTFKEEKSRKNIPIINEIVLIEIDTKGFIIHPLLLFIEKIIPDNNAKYPPKILNNGSVVRV